MRYTENMIGFLALTLSSTKTLPFFFPRGFTTPTGVIMFNCGSPSSSAVNFLFLCFFIFNLNASAGFFSLSCFDADGGAAAAVLLGGFLVLLGALSTPAARFAPLLDVFVAACLFFTVFVRDGAIVAA